MIGKELSQFLLLVLATLALALPCAAYLVRVFRRRAMPVDAVFGSFERIVTTIIGQQCSRLQSWESYALSAVIFNFMGGIVLFLILLLQDYLPWNPQHFPGLSPDLAFTVSASFISNTDWQPYSGEMTLSFFSQMVGLTVQNYLSAATGLAVAFAVIRGFTYRENGHVGNFYADVIRVTIYILLPLAILFSLFLIWQGVPQNMVPFVHATTLEGARQTIAQGPVASQTAISLLGSNGGGFFNANNAHPYANPTPLSNFAEIVAILLLPVSLVIAFGQLVGDRRQGWALFVSMSILFVVLFSLCLTYESVAPPILDTLNIDYRTSDMNPGGNMEGKENRFGIFDSVLWSVATTGTSNGAVNSMLDSAMPLASIIPLFNLLVGCIIYGGVGCGLYGILIYALITVFIAGLMVGRTPEYLGKKIETREIKFAVIASLVTPLCILIFGVISLLSPEGAKSITAAGPHGLTQTLYTYASVSAGNGSSFSGFNANTFYQNIALGVVALIGRFGIIIPVLAIAGSLASKKIAPTSSGTFPTHGAMFVVLLLSVIILFGGLTYFPALALGPVAEHLTLFAP